MLILELTEEDRKNYLFEPIASLELSKFTLVYTDLYLKLTMGFYFRTGKTPDLVRRIAQVWAEGVAELYEERR